MEAEEEREDEEDEEATSNEGARVGVKSLSLPPDLSICVALMSLTDDAATGSCEEASIIESAKSGVIVVT